MGCRGLGGVPSHCYPDHKRPCLVLTMVWISDNSMGHLRAQTVVPGCSLQPPRPRTTHRMQTLPICCTSHSLSEASCSWCSLDHPDDLSPAGLHGDEALDPWQADSRSELLALSPDSAPYNIFVGNCLPAEFHTHT